MTSEPNQTSASIQQSANPTPQRIVGINGVDYRDAGYILRGRMDAAIAKMERSPAYRTPDQLLGRVVEAKAILDKIVADFKIEIANGAN
jgi:hypothetical protein